MRSGMLSVRTIITLSLLLAACSVVVSPLGHPEFCSEQGQDCGQGFVCAEVEGDFRCVEVQCMNSFECEAGHYCFRGFCVAGCDADEQCLGEARCLENICREPQIEICNNIDDDLDGEVDEGFDRDGDGYSSCEFVTDPPDCNDDSDHSRPGLSEICDGLDNDCNNLLDEDTCRRGEICDPAARTCVAIDDCESDAECGEGRLCSPEGRCVSPATFGQACLWDGQCTVGRCLVTYNLGIPGSHCTELCCSEDDCTSLGQDSWCADNGSGLRLCAPEEWYDGTSEVSCGGASCPSCTSDNTCHQQCCGRTQCSDGCHFVEGRTPATDPELVGMFMCDVRPEGFEIFEIYSPIIEPGSCRSGLYWTGRDPILGTPLNQCTEICCDAMVDCPTRGGVSRCVLPGDFLIPVCYDSSALGALGDRPYGSGTCAGVTEWEECESGVCHPDGYCTDVCCPRQGCETDDDGRRYSCRPQLIGGTHHANLCTRDE